MGVPDERGREALLPFDSARSSNERHTLNGRFSRFGTLALALVGAALTLAGVAAVAAAAPPPANALPAAPLAWTDGAADGPAASLRASAVYTLPDPVWRIGVSADGLYRLSYEALAAAGAPVADSAPSDFHLLWRGQEVALEEVGMADGTLDPGDAFLFYGLKFHGPVQDEQYTDENVYWLAVLTTTPGLRMASRSAAPGAGGLPLAWYTATVRAEQNNLWWARYTDAPVTYDTWFWEDTHIIGGVITRNYGVPLTNLAPASYTAVLRLEVAARTRNDFVSPDHHLRLGVNGATVGEVAWDGWVGAAFTLPAPSSALVAGVNQVNMTILTDLSADQWIYMNWVEIAFRRAFVAEGDRLAWTAPVSGAACLTLTGFSTSALRLYDLSDPLAPVRLVSATAALSGSTYALAMRDVAPAGTAYLAAAESVIADVATPTLYHPRSDLLDPAEGADEIIIAPAEFITALQPLADQRRSQGLRVQVVDVDDIYPLFNGGVFHPEAIRAFVAYAYERWPGPPPAYLLLMGDGNWNFKGRNPALYGPFVPTLIPPYLEFADPEQGEVPVDSRFGDVDGDGMPEVAVGRIPAGSVAQVEGAVAKILAYENAPPAPWQWRLLLVADNGKSAPEGFEQIADNLARDFVPAGADVRRVYLRDYCAVGTCTPAKVAPATLALTRTWSEGVVLLTYVGHGAPSTWAHEPLLAKSQLASLTGTEGLPFVIALDCWDGYWVFPPKYSPAGADTRSMSEWATTVLADRGAIAAFGPAGLGFPGVEEQMTRAMYQALFEDGVYRLGPLTQAGREAISWSYMARTYTLFGDPALALAWWDRLVVAPPRLTMTVGTSVSLASFVVTGVMGSGREFALTPTWTADAGVLDGWVYTAPTQATTVHLTASYGPVSTVVTATVAPGEPVSVSVFPRSLRLYVGQTAQMTATVVDRWGNTAGTPVWSADIGAIDAHGVFTAPLSPASGWITASAGALTDRARVEVWTPLYLPMVLRSY